MRFQALAAGAKLAVVRLRFVALMAVVAAGVAWWDDAARAVMTRLRPPRSAAPADGPAVEFFCPMDPQVIRQEPASCPICGMPLSKRRVGAPVTLPPGTLRRVALAPHRVALAGVGLATVERRPLEQTIVTVGAIAVDERRLARIAARVKGRVDRLFVDFTGTEVRRGDPLVALYSQDLITSTRELLLARAQGGPLLEAARRRLLLWGLTEEQVARLERQDQPETHLEVLSPIAGTVLAKPVVAGQYVAEGTELYAVADLSVLWMIARVYEDEAPLVRLGQAVTIQTSAYPERLFEGHVSFVEPVIDPATRTVGVRVDVPNAHRLLRPGQTVRATLRAPLGPDGLPARPATEVVYRCCAACPEIEAKEPGPCPKCAMPLTPFERATPGAGAAGAPGAGRWVCACPMHPDEVHVGAGPGPCDLCGAPRTFEPGPGAAPEGGAPHAHDPAAGPGAGAGGPAGPTRWWCPMHPEVEQDEPGVCTKCGGMRLLPKPAPAGAGDGPGGAAGTPAGPDAGAGRRVWVCPAHPDATRTSEGTCPACGAATYPARIPPALDAPGRTVFVCLMHEDQTRAHEGICEACGGCPLEPVTVPAVGQQEAQGPAPAAGPGSRPQRAPGATRTIYVCPMHPEANRDEPGECEACGGMRLIPTEVPVEDTSGAPLAVPIDAVIDTGGEQVVYVEVAPGLYDAVRVVTGPRVGGWAPVISGLRAGQRVVARGAFLVDAEARLAPGAAATYFGASGGPSGAAPPGGGPADAPAGATVGGHAGHGGGR